MTAISVTPAGTTKVAPLSLGPTNVIVLLLASGGDVPHCGTAQVPLAELLLEALALDETLAHDDVPPSLPVLPPVKVDPVVVSGAVVCVVPSPEVDVPEEVAPAELVTTVDALSEEAVLAAEVPTEALDSAVDAPLDAEDALDSEDEALRELLPSELRSELWLRPLDDATPLEEVEELSPLDSADDARLSPSDELALVDARAVDVDSALRDPPALRLEAPDTDEVTDMPQTHAS